VTIILAKVVIIDDNGDRATSVCSVLNTNGYESSLVEPMNVGLAKTYRDSPDVIMLAEQLSDWNGQTSRHYRIIYPNLYASKLSENDGLFFAKLGRLLKAQHVVAISFSLN